ncbi:hypothetical protein SteCoe_26436 [Stentor coeruleus]|uniref:Uncharacterized protein n=1 Tax=Stentor coeruleus TaxID=5963 RepID=A0A1R2BDA6_9CILI|nr:hypothetical protein SteCoe_26436 [Stentor coeruleus]
MAKRHSVSPNILNIRFPSSSHYDRSPLTIINLFLKEKTTESRSRKLLANTRRVLTKHSLISNHKSKITSESSPEKDSPKRDLRESPILIIKGQDYESQISRAYSYEYIPTVDSRCYSKRCYRTNSSKNIKTLESHQKRSFNRKHEQYSLNRSYSRSYALRNLYQKDTDSSLYPTVSTSKIELKLSNYHKRLVKMRNLYEKQITNKRELEN